MVAQSLRPEIGAKVDLACPLCRKQQSFIFQVGLREDPEGVAYLCGHCRLQFIEQPYADLKQYYREEYRKAHDASPGAHFRAEKRFGLQQLFMFESAKEFMAHVPEGTSVLEIGCSAGGFLSHLVGKYELYGNEWNAEDARYVREVGELPCEEGNLPDIFPGKKFGAVVACHVLEHVPDPVGWMLQIKDRLIGGGFIYLETPNANDALVTVYDIPEFKRFWYRKPHITYWHAEVLAALMTTTGFEARVSYFQRYGLLNHMHWLRNRCPMEDPMEARALFRPVNKAHPVGPVLNRAWGRIDKDYRLWVESIAATDSLRVIGRRREI